MNNKSFYKRILSGFLAVLFAGTSVFVPPTTVYAAPVYGIQFYDIDPSILEKKAIATIVEGTNINIETLLPPNYEISATTPFAVRKSGSSADESANFNITSGAKNNYILTAKAGAAGADIQEYTIDAIYTAFVKEGSGVGVYDDTTTGVSNRYVLNAVSKNELAMIDDSSITFSIKDDAVEGNPIVTNKISAATGAFATYLGIEPSMGPIQKDAKGSFFTLKVRSGLNFLDLVVYIEGSAPILKNTTFTIDFNRQTLNSLVATIITPTKAVKDTVENVRDNPTFPNATDIKIPYVILAGGETLNTIGAYSKSFNVLSKFHRYNVSMELDWAWKADKPEHQDKVKYKLDASGRSTFSFENRPYENMTGQLVVTAKFAGESSVSQSITVTILGTGDLPTVTPASQWTGVPGKPPTEKEQAITEIPKIMDAYDGKANFDVYQTLPKGPFKFTASINGGSGNGTAKYAKIFNKNTSGGEFEVLLDGNVVPYKLGDKIENINKNVSIDVRATKEGQAEFVVEFYNEKDQLMAYNTHRTKMMIYDNRPNTDGRLSKLNLRLIGANADDQEMLNNVYPSGVMDYGFVPETNTYTITVPNKAQEITLKPVIPTNTGAKDEIVISYDGAADDKVNTGKESNRIQLSEQNPKTIRATVMAEDGSLNVYTLNILRAEKSAESRLKGLEAVRTDIANAPNLITGFSPDIKVYNVSVPYRAKEVELKVDTMSPWVSNIAFTPAPKTTGFWFWKKDVLKFDLVYEIDPVTGELKNNVTKVSVVVEAENGIDKTTYEINFTRLSPSTDNTLKNLKVTDNFNKPIPFSGNQKFDPNVRDYYVTIPYSAKTVNIEAMNNDVEAPFIDLTAPAIYGGKVVQQKTKKDTAVLFRNVDVAQNIAAPEKEKDEFMYTLEVTAESGDLTVPSYAIHFTRSDPDSDTRLASITITDQDAKPVDTFSFNQEQLEYTIDVPYSVTRVTVTPKAVSPIAKVVADGAKITDSRQSVTVELLPSTVRDIVIEVTAESLDKRTYTLHIKRSAPSKEARLSDLTVDALPLKPKFNPNTLNYEIVIPEKTVGYTVKPTTVDKFATISVNGKAVVSGAASEKIVPTDPISQAIIEVTAQDGQTKVTYKINVRDENRIEKSSNADLMSVSVDEGAISPRFLPAINTYDVAVKNEAASILIKPKPADEFAKVEVLDGTRVLESYGGTYATALVEDETALTVKVTAPDASKTKEYKFTVYRNNEEKAGIYKPITSDMVNWTQDIIYVDITKYAIVTAEVFNKLKTEYPDKTMVFLGNDYTLEIKGSDILTLIPNTEQFDLSLTYNGPNNQRIIDLMTAIDAGNAGIGPVIVHFNHHGALPGPMKLTLSLGGFYKNTRMYWNYFNEERNRIDYYGYFKTNSQGTFSVVLNHMSDYPITGRKVLGAENKVSGSENIGGSLTGGKLNPSTGEKEN